MSSGEGVAEWWGVDCVVMAAMQTLAPGALAPASRERRWEVTD